MDTVVCPDCDTEYNPVDYWCCPTCRNRVDWKPDENEHPVDCTCEECAAVMRSAGYELMDDDDGQVWRLVVQI